MKHPIIRGTVRHSVDCDICGKESDYLIRIGFSDDRDEDKQYCASCKERLFDDISNGAVLKGE